MSLVTYSEAEELSQIISQLNQKLLLSEIAMNLGISRSSLDKFIAGETRRPHKNLLIKAKKALNEISSTKKPIATSIKLDTEYDKKISLLNNFFSHLTAIEQNDLLDNLYHQIKPSNSSKRLNTKSK